MLLPIGMYGNMYAFLVLDSVLSLEEDVSIAAATDRKLANRAALCVAFIYINFDFNVLGYC